MPKKIPGLSKDDDVVVERPLFLNEIDTEGVVVPWGSMADGLTLPRFTLSYNGVPFAPVGDIHAMTGQSGHGKTMTYTLLMGAILRGEYGGIRWELDDIEPRVLYVDTEQAEGTTKLVVARVHEICGRDLTTDYPDFRWVNLRNKESLAERWKVILKAIEFFRPTVVFLDGMLDMIKNINDDNECSQMVRRVMAMTSYYGMSIWCLVHQNPGRDDKMRGQIGSVMEFKVSDILKTVRHKDKVTGNVSFEVDQIKTRYKPIANITFTADQGKMGLGVPHIFNDKNEIEEKADDHSVMSVEEALTRALPLGVKKGRNQLRDELARLLKCRAVTAAERIAEAVRENVLTESENDKGKGYLYERVPTEEDMRTLKEIGQSELDF